MWSAAASAADWRVYVCWPTAYDWVYHSGSDSSRTHCDTDDKYAHGRVWWSSTNASWIIDHLGTGSIPPISQPGSARLQKLYDTPDPSCATVWVSWSNSGPGCGFGLDMASVYRAEGVWNMRCDTYYLRYRTFVSVQDHRYEPPCDRYETGSDPFPVQYDDVTGLHPFAIPIFSLTGAGIVRGYADATFRPTAPVTRQTMAAYLYRQAGEPDMTGVDDGFSDVGDDHPFRDAIAWMTSSGLAQGYSDGTFRPGELLSRQAAAAYLHRLAGTPNPSGYPDPGYADVPVDHPFHGAIRWMTGAGITKGYDDGLFRPTATLSRQALASFLYLFIDNGWSPTMPSPSEPTIGP
jgi:hypothetical protein